MPKALFTLLLLLFCFSAQAQFNDSTSYYASYGSTGSINKTGSGRTYLLNNALKFSIQKKQATLNADAAYVYGAQDRTLTNNDFTSTLDFNLYQKSIPNFYYWGLGNYTSSYSLKINSQLQTGAGIAYDLLHDSSALINISDGILYEQNDVYLEDTIRDVYNTFRNSLRLRFKWTLRNVFVFSGSGFLQNSLSSSSDYIIKADAALGIKLRKWLSFTAALSYNRFTRTNHENLLFTYGLTVERYF